jgi:DNA-directed RNA polymerase subunit alpha
MMDVWTDGTINPYDAVIKAADILVSYYRQIVTPQKVEEEKKEEPKNDLGPIGKLSVEELGLPTRVANALLKADYETVEDLMNAKRSDLVKVRNLGEKSVKIIDAALGERGLELPRK